MKNQESNLDNLKLNLLEKEFRLQESQKKALKKIGVKTIEDLLYHFPTRYGDTAKMQNMHLYRNNHVLLVEDPAGSGIEPLQLPS